jgi:transposase
VQHRYEWRYLVGFVHPSSGRTIFHLATSVNVPLFEAELVAFAKAVRASPSKQVVLVLDRAGWHSAQRLRVPDHVHLLFLPPYSPELQPAEHLWPLTNAPLTNAPLTNAPLTNAPLTNAPLINRHFDSIEQLEEAQLACCATLQRQAERIRSTACFHWWPRRLKKPGEPRSG